MKISELYFSLQGEGSLTGKPSVFVRTSGCNLRCWFCDTPYASWKPEGSQKTIQEILDAANAFPANHMVITGGEPMIFAELQELCRQVKHHDFHITIETAGTSYQSLQCDLISISPKLASSTPDKATHPRWAKLHEQRRYQPQVIQRLIDQHEYQIKFVVDSPADCAEIESYLQKIPVIERTKVWLMPQGVQQQQLEDKRRWLEPYCQQQDFNFCPRMHIQWYGNVRGT